MRELKPRTRSAEVRDCKEGCCCVVNEGRYGVDVVNSWVRGVSWIRGEGIRDTQIRRDSDLDLQNAEIRLPIPQCEAPKGGPGTEVSMYELVGTFVVAD